MTYLFLMLAIICEVCATSFLKAAQGFTVLVPSLAVVVGYGFAFYFLSLSLAQIPVGIAYAIWAGLGIVLICLSGFLFYGQRLDWPAILGITMIVGGVVCIKFLSKAV